MSKKTFYALQRYKDGPDGEMKSGYLKKDGLDVQNDFGLNLGVYKTMETKPTDITPTKIWYVVDADCGLSIASGDTKAKAVQVALERLKGTDMEVYKEKVRKAIDTYGLPPNRRLTYV